MRYEIILKYFQDDATGSWGLAPKGTINHDNGFNAFWGADGIFHDVFEHYVEGIHPYFSHNGFMTIWGEMCASGHALAYRNLGINNFRYRSNPNRDFTADTIGEVQEVLYELGRGQEPYFFRFDMSKETCLVPYQPCPRNSYELGTTIREYRAQLESYAEEKDVNPRKAIWMPGIDRNYIYGWKRAQKIIGRDWEHSYQVLDDFLTRWHKFTTRNSAEHLWLDDSEYGFYGIRFTVENKGKLKVKEEVLECCTMNAYPLTALNSY